MSNSHISAKTLDTDTILQIFADTSEHTQQGDKEGYCIVREHHALAITRKLFTAMEGVNIAPAQPAAQDQSEVQRLREALDTLEEVIQWIEEQN